MIYTFVQAFDPWRGKYISDEDKLELAKLKCVNELAKALMEHAKVHINLDRSVEVKIET